MFYLAWLLGNESKYISFKLIKKEIQQVHISDWYIIIIIALELLLSEVPTTLWADNEKYDKYLAGLWWDVIFLKHQTQKYQIPAFCYLWW